ncbi:MAG: cyclopropane-fatty-acyl-phospholipid synthase family protein [Pseudomonadota bacterium]|nr:cyclopropane-fatty-acyl-phospholipid synthase family protein [Pseudomonadota bacterium]
MVFDLVLRRLIKTGKLIVTDWKGRVTTYGDATGEPVHIKFNTAAAARKMALDPDLQMGECYMSGEFEVTQGSVFDFLALALKNAGLNGKSLADVNRSNIVHDTLYKYRMARRRFDQRNDKARARQNVKHHYDLSGDLYDLFLDKDRQYSCAYFEHEKQSLDDAQLAKKRHIAAKLNLKPGMKVLDIGSGWGGLGLYLAEMYGVDFTGVTLSEEQFKISNDLAKERGLSDKVRFLLQDYRTLEGKFDRIVSVGMFEHVGVSRYSEFFKKCAALLKPDGTALLHSINRSDGPGATSSWIAKYIFPGGYVPSLSEVTPVMEKLGLYVTDIEILRMHYARTLDLWRSRFMANRHKAKAVYDERFCRMWEFYLALSECGFRFVGMNNFQIQFGLDQYHLPFTRDYILAEEAKLRIKEAKSKYYKAVPTKKPAAKRKSGPRK